MNKIFKYGAALIVGCVLSVSALAENKITRSPVVSSEGCTAFFIGNDWFLTAGHCAANTSDQLTMKTEDKLNIRAEYIAFANPFEGGKDWALIKAKGSYVTKDMTPLKVMCDYDPTVGDSIAVTGYPSSLGQITIQGKIASSGTSPYEVWKHPVMRLNASLTYGSSGSPVILEKTGEVIGIAVGIEPRAPTLSIAQPVDFVCDILNYAP